MQSFLATAVRRRITVLMVALAASVFGVVGYSRLQVDLFPDISHPSLTVQTEFPDAAPQEIENLITRPVEEAVGVLRGLQVIHSVSRSGVSEVTLEFDWGSDMDLLSMEVRDQLDRLILPDEAEDPIVLRFDPALDPMMRLAISGPDKLTRIRTITEKEVKQKLETIRGVAAARIKGGLEEEIQVNVDQERLAILGITLDRVRQVVGMSNINMPGGSLRSQDSQYLIRTVNEFDDIEEIKGLVVRQDEAGAVRVGDVADVVWGEKEREEISRADKQECVQVDVFREGDANTVTVAKRVSAALAELESGLPEGYSIRILFNQASFIEQAIKEVRNAAVLGGLLAIGILFAFLRNARSTIIIAVAIPLSILTTFLAMYRMDISLNLMSLGGLTLGVGMLVDNAIVVLESIFRKRQVGETPEKAAVQGALEVGPAVLASTLTTVAVFLPIVFVEGVAGQLFHDQAWTVALSLMASLLVALTVIPMWSAWGANRHSPDRSPQEEGGLDPAATPRTLGWFSDMYSRVLGRAMAHPILTVLVAAGIFSAAVFGVKFIDRELIPPMSQGEFFFEVKMPEGTALVATDRVITVMENTASEDDRVDHTYATIGSRLVAGGMSVNTKAENLGQLNIVLKNREDSDLEALVLSDLREKFSGIPEAEIKSGKPSYFTLKTPVEVVLFGEDLDRLRDYSIQLAERLSEEPGLADVRSSLEAGNPEIQISFDRRRLASLGLDLATLSETLKSRVLGDVPTRFKEGDRQIDVRVRNQESDREQLSDVYNLVLPGPEGRPIRLVSVADIQPARGPAEIHRVEQQRAAMVTANLVGRGLGSASEAILLALQDTPPPGGIEVELQGQNKEMQRSFGSLRFAILLAIFLVYIVMAATFESLVHPFIVLFSVPLALVGVVAGLAITGTPVSVIVLIGAIMLIGIVVNNAIVLIDAINRLRRKGMHKAQAVVYASHLRLRPILMTTLTTVLGMLPMAMTWGEGAELRAPLGVTVAWGLALSTLLTLVVIPAAYMMVPSHIAPDTEGSQP